MSAIAPVRPSEWRPPAPFSATAAGQCLAFLPSGSDRRDALMALVAGAKATLRLCVYIYGDDATGRALRDALVAAATRGVAVTLIVDGFGDETGAGFFDPLRRAGGTVYDFSPRWTHRYLIRNHQKIIIADGARAIIGGFNIADDYVDDDPAESWTDLGVRIEGSAAGGLTRWFDLLADWTGAPGKAGRYAALRRAVREWRWSDGNATLLVGGPTRGLSRWAASVRRDLARATRTDLLMAYFSPGPRLTRLLGGVARRGRARLVLAAKSDNAATVGAARSHYRALLKRGADIYEFEPGRLHTKLLVIDDAVYLGSANLDTRSLYVNLEIMLRIEDAALAEAMRRFIDAHQAAALHVTPAVHRRRATWWNRLRWTAGWLLVSVIDYTVSRRLNLGL